MAAHPAGQDRGDGGEDARRGRRDHKAERRSRRVRSGRHWARPETYRASWAASTSAPATARTCFNTPSRWRISPVCSPPSSAPTRPIARTAALLHDIGKALDHEVQGTHVEIGRRILEKFGVDARVIQAMQSHHDEYPYETPEAVIVQVADAVSGSRPGARRDTVDRYLERLGDLERLAGGLRRR